MLKDYLLDVMQQHEHGLYMCELPTGNGKTYDSARAMKEYAENFSNPYRAAEQGFIDEIIMPRQTRFKLIQALEMAKNKSQSNPPKKHGNMPL